MTQAALDIAAGIYAYDSKGVLKSLHNLLLAPCPQPVVKDSEERVDLWITILCDPGYPARIIQPWICASGVNKVVTYPCPSSFTCTF